MKWLVALSLLLCAGCASTPSGLRCPDRYRGQVLSEFADTDARLAKIGYAPLGDDPDIEIVVEQGDMLIDGTWYKVDKVQMVAGQWQYGPVGGYWAPGRITAISDPAGNVKNGRFAHEGAHQSLYDNGKGTDPNLHHSLMKQVGIHGAWK